MILDNGSPTLIDLEEVRADGWFEQLGEESPDFDELCQVLGRRFVAFAFITGVRVTAITYDARTPHASLVDFVVGEDEPAQRMAVSELRERLGAALLASDEPDSELPDAPSAEDREERLFPFNIAHMGMRCQCRRLPIARLVPDIDAVAVRRPRFRRATAQPRGAIAEMSSHS